MDTVHFQIPSAGLDPEQVVGKPLTTNGQIIGTIIKHVSSDGAYDQYEAEITDEAVKEYVHKPLMEYMLYGGAARKPYKGMLDPPKGLLGG
jgi:hypothetical protein